MIQTGKNLTAAADPLQKTELTELCRMIMKPTIELKNRIQQLRAVLTIDPVRYRQQKTTLPYFTCGIFNPPFRKTENFASIDCFVLDFDHLRQKELTPNSLKQKIQTDERIAFIFESPGGDGIKVLFSLAEKCHDHAKFSMFYRLFAIRFAMQYDLQQVVDAKTCDVTRACFISADPDAFYNPQPVKVAMADFINFDSHQSVQQIKNIIAEDEKKQKEIPKQPEKTEIAPDILQQIREKLNPNIKIKREKIIHVPEKMEQIVDEIKSHIASYSIAVKDIQNIHYGKKITVEAGNYWAEVNVFYGKKGFSVVPTPKRGSNAELCELTRKILCELLL